MRKFAPLLTATVTVVLAAIVCGKDDDGGPNDRGQGSGSLGSLRPGISINEALSSDLLGALLVNGYLVIRGGEHDDPEEVRLCEALAESYPPQCSSGFC